MARLVVNREEADLVTHELTRDIVTIGSAPLNHIVIDDPAVSAQHAILARVADSYRLKDLNSTNGTQVNVPPDARPISKLKRRAREGNTSFQACSTETAERAIRP